MVFKSMSDETKLSAIHININVKEDTTITHICKPAFRSIGFTCNYPVHMLVLQYK